MENDMSSFRRDASPNLSLREKALVKRRVNKEHNSNFRAGYVHVNEEHLHKTGIRGRKRYFIYTVTCIAVLIVIVNILLTFIILGVLQISKDGMYSLEFMPSGALLRFLEPTDLGEVYVMQGRIIGLPDSAMDVSGNNDNNVYLKVGNSSTVSVSPQKISFKSKKGYKIIHPGTGKTIFNTDSSDSYFNFPQTSKTLDTDRVYTERITSDVDEDLFLESGSEVTMRGSEGLYVDGFEMTLHAEEDVVMTSGQKVVLDGAEGVYLDQLSLSTDSGIDGLDKEATYKICVCMPSGTLFAVPNPYTCDQANENKSPCLD